MKELETGIISEDRNEAEVISGPEFMDRLLYDLNFERIVIIRDGENFKFECTNPEDIEKARKLIYELLTEKGD